MGLLLAKSGRSGSSHKDWFSFWGPRHGLAKALDAPLLFKGEDVHYTDVKVAR